MIPSFSSLPVDANYAAVLNNFPDFVMEKMGNSNIAGLSISIVDDQRVVWSRGFGYANKNQMKQVTPETLFQAGSISKLFTTTAILQLVDNGLISLDDPIEKHLAEFSIKKRFDHSRSIIIRDLLTHHSGLPSDYLREFPLDETQGIDVLQILKSEYASRPPGKAFSYSNIDYQILEKIIEIKGGESFSQYMQNNVLNSLGMNSSCFELRPGDGSLLSKGHYTTHELEAFRFEKGSGGLFTSTEETAEFIKMIFAEGLGSSGRLLQPESVKMMLTRQNEEVEADLDFSVGLGWFLSWPDLLYSAELPSGITIAYHTGDALLFRSILLILPEQKIGIVIYANSEGAAPAIYQIAAKAIAIILQSRHLEANQNEKQNIMDKTCVGNLAGYCASLDGLAEIKGTDGIFHANIGGNILELKKKETGEYSARYLLGGFFPLELPSLQGRSFSVLQIEGEDILALRENDGKLYPFGLKIQIRHPNSVWKERAGWYRILNRNKIFQAFEGIRLDSKDDMLLLSYFAPHVSNERTVLYLDPVSDDEAVISGIGQYLGETLQVRNSAEGERIYYSGFELMKEK
jgi:CubicO group peptidase (beta-lactamase class C family)